MPKSFSQLTTVNKVSLIESINELNANIGDPTKLYTSAKTSMVNAINEFVSDVGNTGTLKTTARTVVGAINELSDRQAVVQAPSTATDVAGVVSDLNALITKLKNAKIMKTS